jgi:glycosyltransferase involved in cell wall biosynthesis
LHAFKRLNQCLPYLVASPTPLVTTCHDARATSFIPAEIAPSIELADAVIALSPAIERVLLAAGGTRVYYIPNGVDTQLFCPLKKRPNTVAAIGRNTPRKRMVDVARFFLERPEYELTLCGPRMKAGPDEGRPVIPLGSNITVLDNQPEHQVARLLGESEYFVHLAREEACALVVREAMASGCRVWTIPPNDQDLTNVALSWKDAVADPGLGTRAAAEAAHRFDWLVIARRHAMVFAETLGRWRANPASTGHARRRYEAFAASTHVPSGP